MRIENFENGFEKFGITLRLDKTFVKNMKGKTLGKTLNAQAERPESEAEIYFDGFASMQNKKKTTKIVRKIDVKDICFFDVFFFKTFSKIV